MLSYRISMQPPLSLSKRASDSCQRYKKMLKESDQLVPVITMSPCMLQPPTCAQPEEEGGQKTAKLWHQYNYIMRCGEVLPPFLFAVHLIKN